MGRSGPGWTTVVSLPNWTLYRSQPPGDARLQSGPHSPDRLSVDPGAVQEGIAGPGFVSGNVQGVNISLQGVVGKPETPLVQVFHTHVPFLRT